MGKKKTDGAAPSGVAPSGSMRFVSLHTHTTFSYGDGYGPVPVHIDRVADLGMKAVGFTEHGNTSSHAQAEKAAKARGIQAMYGCELYVAPTDTGEANGILKTRKKCHQTVLAGTDEGYRNLNRIVSNSWKHGYFQWPTTSAKMLNDYRKGLFVLSGCSDSILSCTLLGGKEYGEKRLEYSEKDFKKAVRLIHKYQDMFGERYLLEVQRFPQLERTRILNPALAELSKVTGAKLVGTADVHYPFPHQNKMQPILHAASRGGTVASAEAGWEYDILLTYPTSDEEIIEDLIATGLSHQDAYDAVLNTEWVASQAQIELPKSDPIRFPFPGSKLHGEERTRAWDTEEDDDEGYVKEYATVEEYLWEMLRRGWKFRAKTNRHMRRNKKEYLKRLKYEMGMITEKDFLDYFAMVSDSVQFAKDQKIAVGPARGSAAASLVCYLLRITEIDPMQFPNMLFSRFIDPNRMDMPDIDLDFADDRRHEVRDYLVHVYGDERVGNIANFVMYKGKNSIDDVARVYRIPTWAAKTIKGLIVERSGGDARANESLADTFEMFPKAKKVLEQFPQFQMATKLEGNMKGMSVHAAGLVISSQPISDTCALYTRPKDSKAEEFNLNDGNDFVTVLPYNKYDAEYLNMLKMDYLGLSTMGVIGRILTQIGMDLEDLYRIPITEPTVLKAFADNDLVGIFQYEGRATTIVNRDVAPTTFDHLADINALSRPGPLFSGMTADYCAVKNGHADRKYLHPVVDEITDWTYGQIVYQEQVLKILSELAGFPAIRVGDIRRIISKKSGMQVMEQAFGEFRDGCYERHGVEPDLARKIWDYIATSSTYSFNQSHSVSYAMLAFWLMFLKINHPAEFYSSALSRVGDGTKTQWKRTKLINDAERHGIRVLPPSITESGALWSCSDKTIIGGFQQVHGIGPTTAAAILNWRDQMKTLGKTDLEWKDLIQVKGIGPATIEKIKAFVASDDPYQTQRVRYVLDSARAAVGESNLPSLSHHSTEMPQTGVHDVVWIGMARNLNFKDAVEAERARTGKDEDEILANLKSPELRKSCVIQAYDEGDEDVYLRINRFNYPALELELQDLVTDQDVVLAVGKKREGFGISIQVEDIWVMKAETEEEETEDDE